MYAKIAVLTYQAPQISTYTYQIPKVFDPEIKIGQLVNVPFGKRNPYGIILDIEKELSHEEQNPKLTIKPLNTIVLKNPILLPNQIKLAIRMSNYYISPVSKCLEAMLPEIPKGNYDFQKTIPSSKTTRQTVVLVPTINQIPKTIAMFKTKNFALYHSELKADERFDAWQNIKGGNFDFIFGTRSAIFTPCPNLKEIIIFDEHDSSYKDQRSPYFDTLTIAQMIKSQQAVELKIIDPAPKVTTYFSNKKHHRFQFEGTAKQKETKTKIVSMVDEKHAGNKLPISDLLQNYIKLGTQKNKRILLFLNKKAQSGHVYCKTCKYSDFAKSEPERCPSCQSSDIYFNSTNVNSLASLVKKLAPNSTVNIMSSGKKSSHEVPVNSNQPIDIATASVFYKLQYYKYDLVAHIYADALLNITDFTSAEKLYGQIANLKKITEGLLLLQTYNPQDETIQNASKGDYQRFFDDQLSQRKALTYPPYALLIKLTIKGKKEQNIEDKAQIIFEQLTSQKTDTSQVAILGPYKPVFTGNTSKYNIIIKVPVPSYTLEEKEKAQKTIAPLLLKVPRDWQITTDPEDLN